MRITRTRGLTYKPIPLMVCSAITQEFHFIALRLIKKPLTKWVNGFDIKFAGRSIP